MNQTSKHRTAARLTGLAAVTLLCYAPCLFLGFAFDDKPRLLQNAGIRSLSNFPLFFSQPSWPGDLYRPLEAVYFALIYKAFEYTPWPYHALSLLLHLSCVIFSYRLIQRLFSSDLAFLTALLFAVHAVHVEAIANVSYVTELSAACFILATLNVSLGTPTILRLSAVFLLTLLGLGSKESAVSLVILLPLSLALSGRWSLRKLLPATVTTSAAVVLYLAWRALLFGSPFATQSILPYDNILITLEQPQLAFNGLVLLGKYLNLTIIPYPLSAIYGYAKILPLGWPLPLTAWLHLFLLALFLFGTCYLSWRKSRLVYGPLFFLSTMALTSNIAFAIGTPFAERLLYLPSLGICLLLAAGLLSIEKRRLQAGLLGFLLVLHIGISVTESSYWANDYERFKREVAISPKSALAHVNYGYQLFIRNRTYAAEQHYHQALRIYPRSTSALRGLALLHLSRRNYPEAEKWLRALLSVQPNNDHSWGLLAETLYSRGNKELALEAAMRALALNPEQAEAREVVQQLRN